MTVKNSKALWHQRRQRWNALDWRLTNKELGRQMKVSQERARQMRRALGKPDSTMRPSETLRREQLQRATGLLARLRGRRVNEAAQLLGCSLVKRTSVRRLLDTNGVLHRWRGKHPWHLMNFSIANAELSRIWRISPAVLSSHRSRHGIKAPEWSGLVFRRGSPRANDPDYRDALATERQTARKFRIFCSKKSASL